MRVRMATLSPAAIRWSGRDQRAKAHGRLNGREHEASTCSKSKYGRRSRLRGWGIAVIICGSTRNSRSDPRELSIAPSETRMYPSSLQCHVEERDMQS
jgi:hypothetical protein